MTATPRPLLLRAALHTAPALYSITMGTGIVSILLHSFPYPARWLDYLADITFALNVLLFVLITLFTLARYTLFRGAWMRVLVHTTAGMSWGCLPMGGATIVNMICYVCVPAWGHGWAYLALGLWWADVLLSVAVSVGLLWAMTALQTHSIASLSPAWLLPILGCVVAASSGAVVASTLAEFDPQLARSTLLATTAVWGAGVPLALMVIALLVYGLAVNGVPAGDGVGSCFLPLGPCGQGAFGVVLIGATARELATKHGMPVILSSPGDAAAVVGEAVHAACVLAGLVLWGLGLVWYLIGMALFAQAVYRDKSLLGVGRFNVGLWSLTFPIGVWAGATSILASDLDSVAFKVIAAFASVQVVLHWMYVGVMTVWKVGRGEMVAPEVGDGEAVKMRRWWKEGEGGGLGNSEFGKRPPA